MRNYPSDPLIVAVAMRQRYDAGQLRAALELVPSISRRSPICGEVHRQLGFWATQREPSDRARLLAAAGELRCQP